MPVREYLTLYDSLPIYHSNYIPDIILTNWALTATPYINNQFLDIKDSGIAWHGFYGKGKWFYFSFPIYVFLDMHFNTFNKIISNIIKFVKSPVTISSYPFLDKKNTVFISEDTEFKYPYGYNFATLAHKHHIKVTLFAVAKLAKEYENITKAIAKYKNCEIGSHSYSHIKIMGTTPNIMQREIVYSKQLLEQITDRKIYGFRPPREEIDNKMRRYIKKAGYMYVMEKTKPYIVPKKEKLNIITIPRIGTDDYEYLVNTDYNKSQILQSIIRETNLITSLNGVFTLSVHTHLLSYKSNISVLDKYFTYLNNRPDLNPLLGNEIARKAILSENIKFNYTFTTNIISLHISNLNSEDIKNLTFRIYTPNIAITDITPEIINQKIEIIHKNKKRRYYDVRLNSIKARSTIHILIHFKNL